MLKARVCCCVAVALCACLSVSAHAADRFTIRGAGFGHGVGMSQYGAYGYALHGKTYDKILAHYYTDTELGRAGRKTVRVLLQEISTASFSGGKSVNGRRLSPGRTYYVRKGPDGVELANAAGRVLRRSSRVLRVRGSRDRIALTGAGSYRDDLEFRTAGVFGVQAVNAVGIEKYVRGVVANESPALWPAEALKAQAVAARTYALTTSKGGNGYDQFADTRSQVYGGRATETSTTDAAVRATKNEVVTYEGEPVVTYFFSTSGGRTENVENSFGGDPQPWLKSVKDPYDNTSPKHRWGPYRWTMATAAAKLAEYVKGSFIGIDVIKRGRSPRIVTADVVGTGGRTRVSGATLRAELELYDTWAYFSSIKTQAGPPAEQDRTAALRAVDPSARSARTTYRVQGRVFPAARGGTVTIQHDVLGHWVPVGSAQTDARGRYAYVADTPGRYRVQFLLDTGPAVEIK